MAIATGALVFYTLQQQQRALAARAQALAEVAPAPDVPTLQLPVAARPLPPGTILSTEDFLLKEFPLDLVPVAAITETISLESRLIVEPIGQGETFSTTKIAGGAGAAISQQIAPGNVLTAFPAGDLLSTANIIEDGDRLDLLLTLQVPSADGESARPVTAFTLQNILVFRVLRPAGEIDARDMPPEALLLSVTPEEAVLIKHVKDSGGTLDFVLRASQDTVPSDVPPVDREDLIARYGLR
jgi:pilus assembly protein CpaB